MRSDLFPVPVAPMTGRVVRADLRGVPTVEKEYLYWLDWVRFLAALAVVVDHTRELNWPGWHGYERVAVARHFSTTVFLSLTQLGEEAVAVFFVLSGLLVGGKTLARVRQGTFDASSYAADRLARIYVPLVPALLLSAAVTLGCGLPWHPAGFLACLAGLQGSWIANPAANTPLWTLAYETWFYMLGGCAAVAAGGDRARGQRLAAGMGALVALGMFCWLDGKFLCCWLMGAGGFWLRDRVRCGRIVWALAGVGIAAVGVVLFQMDTNVLPWPSDTFNPWRPAPELWLIVVAAGALLTLACLMRMPPATAPGVRVERWGTQLAAFSYTLYLTHFPVLTLLSAHAAQRTPGLDGAAAGRALVWMAVCLAVAWIMYALFEAHTPAVRRWLREQLG